jgi:hypothetical protein
VKWFKRLFGKLTKQESQAAPAAKADEPVETPAAVVEKAAEPTEKAPAEEVAEEAPAAKPEPTPADPAINRLDDDERTASALETKDEPATDIAEELAASEPVAEPAEPVAEVPAEPVEEPVAEPAATPVAESPAEPEPAAPVTPATTSVEEGPFGPGSAKPNADGSAPGDDYTVKGKRSSKLFHTAESPYFGRTKADVWFKTPADAESAGFAAWNHKKKAPAK